LTTQQIVDAHFTSNYKRYRGICYQYYRGRYLFEDLLNESYILFRQVKPETIQRFSELDKLHCIVLKIIRSVYQKRNYSARNKPSFYNKEAGCNSSPLFETPTINFDLDIMCSDIDILDVTQKELEIQKHYERATELIGIALQEPVIDQKEKSNFLKITVFLDANRSSINHIHQKTGISRTYLTQVYKEGKQLLKDEILKA